jgi:hypothetical protein
LNRPTCWKATSRKDVVMKKYLVIAAIAVVAVAVAKRVPVLSQYV